MPTTRKQKSKVRNRKIREADKLSDLKFIDMMLGTNNFERKKVKLEIQSEGLNVLATMPW